jgi:polysaccharide export outer membrane protein
MYYNDGSDSIRRKSIGEVSMRLTFSSLILGLAVTVAAQNGQQRRLSPSLPTNEEFFTNSPSNAPASLQGGEYRIGRDDLIDIAVFDAPDLASSGRVSATGFVTLPLVGVVEAAGKTTQELEKTIEVVLKEKYINDPHVTVFIREYASQPVSIVGAVKMPGIYQIKGQKFLLDMLATAQGLDQTMAGKTIQVIRRKGDTAENAETITISSEDLFQNGRTELNIPIQAGDTINVLRASSIYIVGEVIQPGEVPLTQGKNLTAGTAIALGRGFTREAKRSECKIIRIHSDATKEEIPVNVAKILDGSLNDVPLLPNDILFVPSNKVKTGLMKTLDTTIAVVSGRLIYRP